MSYEHPILVSIEGNIGSGKSTMLKYLRELEPSWTFVDEPVDSWLTIRNEKHESLLEVFYHDIRRWAYTFQNAALVSRTQMLQEAVAAWYAGPRKSPIIVMERCLETDRNVFAKMLHEDKKLDEIEWTLYEKWYNLMKKMVPKMNAFVWIDTEPNTCSERIKRRAREGEDDIPLEYLQNLDKIHHTWLENETTSMFRSTQIDDIRKYIHSFE